MLSTYDHDPKKNAYHRESCASASDLSSLGFNGMDILRQTGDAKRNSVYLTALPHGWQVGSSVKPGMALDYVPKCTNAADVATASRNGETSIS